MPIGCLSTLPHIIAHMHPRRPGRVLDLGVGMGMYGAAIRQWLDTGYAPSFKTFIHGVEGFASYRNPCWELYSEIEVRPIEQAVTAAQNGFYDAIILADVIEHFELVAGKLLISSCLDKLAPGGWFYVATPAVFMEQGAAYGNEFERHRSLWMQAHFEECVEVNKDRCSEFIVLQDGSADVFGNCMLTVAFKR